MSPLVFDLLPAPIAGGFSLDTHWVWDGSAVRGTDGTWHMFSSRWPRGLPFHPGWLTSSEIIRGTSDRPEGPYRFAEVVLPARGPEWWDGDATHNPAIVRCADGYLLFYMGTRQQLGAVAATENLSLHDPRVLIARSNKRIGVAWAPRPEGPWTRYDRPILDVAPNSFYSFLTSNPAPLVHPDGSVLLIFKSRMYDGRRHSHMMIGAARAPHWSGPYTVVSRRPLFGADGHRVVEDPFVWSTASGYEMIAKDMTGELCGEKHGGIHALSPDGEIWTVSDSCQGWTRSILWDDGIVRNMGSLERPSLIFDADGRPSHLIAAMADGPGGFEHASRTWTQVIPLNTRSGSARPIR